MKVQPRHTSEPGAPGRSAGEGRRGVATALLRPPSLFFVIAIAMIVIVAVGFAPTFYLRALFETTPPRPALRPHLLVHGSVLASWYMLFVAQTWLVHSRRTRTHMQLGVAGVVLAVAVVASSVVTMSRGAARLIGQGLDPANRLGLVIVSDFWVLVVFTLLVGAAVRYRRAGATHKRLMLLASAMLVGPALSTVRPIGRALVPYLPFGLRPSVVFVMLCIAALVSYDVAARRRVERATLWGGAAIVAAIAMTNVMALNGWAAPFTRWFAGLGIPL